MGSHQALIKRPFGISILKFDVGNLETASGALETACGGNLKLPEPT